MKVDIPALRNPNSVKKIQIATCTTLTSRSERDKNFF